MKIIIANPGKCSRIAETEDIKKTLARIIGVGIDKPPFSKDEEVSVVMGREHRKLMLAPNRLIDTVEDSFPVFGPCVFCRKQDGKYTGLTDEQIQKIEKEYHLPERCFINPELKIMIWEPYDPEKQKNRTGKSRGGER